MVKNEKKNGKCAGLVRGTILVKARQNKDSLPILLFRDLGTRLIEISTKKMKRVSQHGVRERMALMMSE